MNPRLGVLFMLLVPGSLSAQSGLKVDAELAKRGNTVWGNNGCWLCHRIGAEGSKTGPNLEGLFQRRTPDWVTQYLKNTTTMEYRDSVARSLAAEYAGKRMPQFKLSHWDIQAVMHYIALQDSLLRHPEPVEEGR
jgi:cytochrome c2